MIYTILFKGDSKNFEKKLIKKVIGKFKLFNFDDYKVRYWIISNRPLMARFKFAWLVLEEIFRGPQSNTPVDSKLLTDFIYYALCLTPGARLPVLGPLITRHLRLINIRDYVFNKLFLRGPEAGFKPGT